MRLTQAKLAGFKSFVDPTHIPVPGQLVAVVGPNGCGKSNVIDAVRWVLGESSARQLRGESMQDVIFNGSDQRKPVGRASVELLFDNSLGRAAGQWSQYAEISIKRVLSRQGESSYYINNLQCRRRDIADLFLGTGVGTRGYAVIEQGMISRIIEARPEELRVFLEEAAGVSKYKERRKETASRLNDTRDNLLRVDDIRQELAGQLEKLAGQAELAEKYQQLRLSLETTQNLLALLRQQEAEREHAKLERDIAKAVNELEAASAELRETETRLETQREQHFSASDHLHRAQGELYEANAEVARLEQQLLHLKDSRQRIANQLMQARNQLHTLQQQVSGTDDMQAHWQEQLEIATERSELGREALELANQALPAQESEYRSLQQAFQELQHKLATAQQARERALASRQYAQKSQLQLEQRRERLQQELRALAQSDNTELEDRQALLEELQLQQSELEEQWQLAQQQLPEFEARRRAAGQLLQQVQQQLLRHEAQQAALQQLQQRARHNQSLQQWLQQHGLHDAAPLWQALHIEPGWETAVEAVLREMLQALPQPAELLPLLADGAPAKLGFYLPQAGEPIPEPSAAGLQPLLDKVRSDDAAIMAALRLLLQQVYACADAAELLALRGQLPPGARLVARSGHLATRGTLQLFAPDNELHGVVARQRELEQLQHEIEQAQQTQQAARAQQQHAEQQLQQAQAAHNAQRQQLDAQRRRMHQQQLDVLRLQQASEQVSRRRQQLEQELAELAQQLQQELQARGEAECATGELDEQIDQLGEALESARNRRNACEAGLDGARQALRATEREAREAEFQLRSAHNKLQELAQLGATQQQREQELQQQLEELQFELEAFDAATVEETIQAALQRRAEREGRLAAARDAVGHLTNTLRDCEARKLRIEQSLEPLRNQINELRLKAQEARLAAERFAQELAEAGARLEELQPLLQQNAKVSSLVGQIGSLTQQISALGAVNLAAMQELTEARERKQFLDAQADDLNQAMAMLEGAIRKIDKESSELLQSTFDKVNASMGELFPLLFGGGQARLVMSGETILDAGIQVIAQPPGKKNSSIHLLSGGEKALTALSLVFALFQLNPAPFCLLDEVDAPLDDANTGRFCEMVKRMSASTQFLYISHNKLTMEMADQLIGITMQEKGVSRVVAVDIEEALSLRETAPA